MMNVNEKFEEIFISAERHDIISFNRQMIYFLRECRVNAKYDIELLCDDLEQKFAEANLCVECDTQEELEDDQIVIDGQKLFLKICPACQNEFEV